MDAANRCDVINIQKDWDQVMTSQETEKFWISLKRQDQPTLHSYIYSNQTRSEDEKFVIKKWKNKYLQVHCEVTDTLTNFVAPIVTLSLSDKKISCMDISGGGELGVCSSSDGQLWIWEVDTGVTRRVLEGHVANVDSCRFFPSGVVLLSGGDDFRLKIWSVIDGKCARTLLGHTRSVTDTSIIDRGRNIISSSDDGTARLWDCGSGQCVSILSSVNCSINSCDVSTIPSLVTPPLSEPAVNEYCTEDKVLLIVSDDGVMRTFDIRNRTKINEYRCCSSSLRKGVFVGNEKVLIGNEEGHLLLFDLRQMRNPLKSLYFTKSSVTSLLAYSNSQTIVGHKDGSCVLWNCNDENSCYTRLTGSDVDHVTQIATCMSTSLVYSSSRDGSVRIYKI